MISRFWPALCARVRRAFRGESETAEEIRLHLELLIEENRAAGLAPDEARRQAALAFGNAAALQENLRAQRPGFSFELLRRDFALAARFLVTHRSFGAITVLSLALALGANIAIFSLVDALMFKVLPVREPERLALFWWSAPKGADVNAPTMGWWETDAATGSYTCTSFPDLAFERLARADVGLTEVFAFAPMRDLVVMRGGEAWPVLGLTVSGDYFRGLGADMQLGRGLTPEDDASHASVAVISDVLWERCFGRSTDVLGQTVMVNQTALTVVGVARRDFAGTVDAGARADVYLPLSIADTVATRFADLRTGHVWWLRIMGRLAPDATVESVAARAAPVAAGALDAALKAVPPREGATGRTSVLPRFHVGKGAQGLGEARRAHRTQLTILGALGLLVLGVACVNVANLLLARGVARQREVAVKLALGATRGRVLRQFLVEAIVIAVGGAMLGLFFAAAFKRLLLTLHSPSMGQLSIDLPWDYRVAGFTLAVTTVCALVAGLWPAWRNSAVDPSEGFRQGASGGGRRPWGGLLLVVQMALAVVLLVSCALFLRTVNNLRSVDVGFDPTRILMVDADGARAGLSREASQELYVRLSARLARLPGVRHASYAVIPLLAQSGWNSVVSVPGRPKLTGRNALAMLNAVGADYFAALGLPAVRGRLLDERDVTGRRLTAVVNEAFVRRFLGDEEPVGRSIVVRGGDDAQTLEIVGVVRDTLYNDVRASSSPIVFLGYPQGFSSEVTFLLRTEGDAAALSQTVRAIVAEVAPQLALMDFRTQEVQIERLSATEEMFARLAVVFGALAIFLTCVGVFGLVSYRATRRTTEFGVRLALGAQPRAVWWLVLREGLMLGAAGAIGGWAAAFGVVQALQANLFGVPARDPWSFAAAGLGVIAVAVLAAALPAWCAMRVDPAACLRAE